jgi:hypothetical protein
LKEYEDAVDSVGLTDAELAKYQHEAVKYLVAQSVREGKL